MLVADACALLLYFGFVLAIEFSAEKSLLLVVILFYFPGYGGFICCSGSGVQISAVVGDLSSFRVG